MAEVPQSTSVPEPAPVEPDATQPLPQETSLSSAEPSVSWSRVEQALARVEQGWIWTGAAAPSGSPTSSGSSHAEELKTPGSNRLSSRQILQRVVHAMRHAARRNGTLRLKLHPPELGSVRVKLRLRRQGLEALLEVERPEVQQALLEHLGQLRQRLAQQDVKILRFEIDLMDQGFGQGAQGGADHRSPAKQWQAGPERSLPLTKPPAAEPSVVEPPLRAGLDVIV